MDLLHRLPDAVKPDSPTKIARLAPDAVWDWLGLMLVDELGQRKQPRPGGEALRDRIQERARALTAAQWLAYPHRAAFVPLLAAIEQQTPDHPGPRRLRAFDRAQALAEQPIAPASRRRYRA